MSHKVTTLVYSRRVGSAHRKAVLAYMADRASDDGSGIWASKKTISDEIECGRSTVIKICNDFIDEGILVATGSRKCANGATVVYAINLDAVRALEAIKGSTSGTSPDQDPSTSGTPPVHQRDPKGSTSGTQTILEPSMNQEAKASLSNPTSKAKMRLPSDWVPDDTMRLYAEKAGIHADDIKEIANDFLIYWTDQPKSKSTRSLVGWQATWRNNINRIGWQYIRNRSMAGKQASGGRGQGGGLAGELARRRAQG